MAKGRKKSSKNGRATGGSQCGSSDDESVETCSVFSGDSHHPSPARNFFDETDDDDSNGYSNGSADIDSFEDRLKDAIDGTMAKSSQRRVQSLHVLCKSLSGRYCPEFLASRPTTITDVLEKALRGKGGNKGGGSASRGDEQASAATLAAIVVLQYGASPPGTDLYRALAKTLMALMADVALPPTVRERATMALAIAALMAEDDPVQMRHILDQLRTLFSGSFLKGNGSVPNVNSAMSSLHQTALLSWALVLTVVPADISSLAITRNIASVSGMLQSTDVDMRVAAGEALATMFEIARERNQNIQFGDGMLDIDDLCDCLHQLATDSQKFRAKKDRKMQKSSFRDIERAVRDGEGPELNVHFGVVETLRIRSWEDKRTYDALCTVLGSGMNHHLQNNPEIRALFDLGAPLISTVTNANCRATKIPKFERHMSNLLADRNRTKKLAKVRDKRLDVL